MNKACESKDQIFKKIRTLQFPGFVSILAIQKNFRYLWRFTRYFTRYFFVAFPWLFCGPLLSRETVFGPFSSLFRGFFVIFSWFFRGFFVAPVLGKIYAYSPWNSLLSYANWPAYRKQQRQEDIGKGEGKERQGLASAPGRRGD